MTRKEIRIELTEDLRSYYSKIAEQAVVKCRDVQTAAGIAAVTNGFMGMLLDAYISGCNELSGKVREEVVSIIEKANADQSKKLNMAQRRIRELKTELNALKENSVPLPCVIGTTLIYFDLTYDAPFVLWFDTPEEAEEAKRTYKCVRRLEETNE